MSHLRVISTPETTAAQECEQAVIGAGMTMDDEIEMMRRMGMTYRHIQAALGCDGYRIRKVICDRGLSSRESARLAVEIYLRQGDRPYIAARKAGVDKSVAYRLAANMRREVIRASLLSEGANG